MGDKDPNLGCKSLNCSQFSKRGPSLYAMYDQRSSPVLGGARMWGVVQQPQTPSLSPEEIGFRVSDLGFRVWGLGYRFIT